MEGDDAHSVQSEDNENTEYIDRRAILAPAINDVIAALGGYEGDTYVLGDECYGCLKDLKKFWRKDDTDDERTVARIFWSARVLPNDLVPILLATAGKGLVTDKCAIACADIITAMTWPIDLAEELKELDEDLDKGTDYTQLLQSHLHYKAALLRPGVIQALFGILLPCLAKDKKDRKERDGQIINVILHLFRNLAFIKDPPPNMYASSDHAELSSLQSKLIKTYSEAHVLDLLITIASSAKDPFLNQWNTLALETFYLLFRSVSPSSLAMDQNKRSQSTLSQLLALENKRKLENAKNASSRHSRFGTTIAVTRNLAKTGLTNGDAAEASATSDSAAQRLVLHRQQALKQDTGAILDIRKKKRHQKTNKVDELGVQDNLVPDAKNILQHLARTFIEVCFNTFLASLLRDIRSERPKITEKDHLRLLFVTRWFLEFFLAVRAAQIEERKKDGKTLVWGFDLVSEVVERGWIVWILRRMREAVESKPKLWTELQGGIECLTQLLALIDAMHSVELEDLELSEAAELLQQQIVYNGEVLDVAVDALRVYKEGVQSLRYLDASVRLGYSLLRMLEKWSRERGGGELLVRKKKAKRKKQKDGTEDEMPDEQPEPYSDEEPAVQEMLFSFESFELKFAHEEITHSLILYLRRYEEFTSADQMKRVVSLMHRQAVKSKAEGLFFKVSTLNLFRNILNRQSTLPREQPYKDLVALINFILKKFFKAVAEDPMLIVGAFYPMNRNRWKKYSSWEPEQKRGRDRESDEEDKHPAEVQVKRGYSWSEQLGIAVACLIENGQQGLLDWAKEILMMVIGQRQRIIEETDGSSSQDHPEDMDDDDVREAASKLNQPSSEALAKFEDYLIPYVSDEQANAATKNPHMKLLFRLLKFSVLEDNADELEWFVPAAILPSDLQSSLNVINQFIEKPLDLGGKKATQCLSKKTKRRRRRRRAASSSSPGGTSDSEDEPRKKKAKKKKEEKTYKSAQFIEDSDVEYGDDEAFWARERAQREKTERLYAEGKMASLRSTGTKKKKKARGKGATDTQQVDEVSGEGGEVGDGTRMRSPGVSGGENAEGQDQIHNEAQSESPDSDSSGSDSDEFGVDAVLDKNTKSPKAKAKKSAKKAAPRPRPKARPAYKRPVPDMQQETSNASETPGTSLQKTIRSPSPVETDDPKAGSDSDIDMEEQAHKPKTKARIVYSDEDE